MIVTDTPPDVTWLDPLQRSSPAESLARIKALCEFYPELCSAMLAIVGTHQMVPGEMLAAAVKQFRRDLDPYTPADVAGLIAALINGGRQGFDAVLRTRKASANRSAPLSWVKE